MMSIFFFKYFKVRLAKKLEKIYPPIINGYVAADMFLKNCIFIVDMLYFAQVMDPLFENLFNIFFCFIKEDIFPYWHFF